MAGVLLSITAFCSVASAKETLVKNVAEFDAAVESAAPGDHILLADGEWRDAELVFRGEGLWGVPKRPIVLSAQTPGKVILTGTSRIRIGGKCLTVRNLLWRDSAAIDDVISFRIDSKTLARECAVEDCAILGDMPDTERKWVSLYGEYNLVSRCRFEGKKSSGTLLVVWLGEGASSNQHVIIENFFGVRTKLGKNGGEIIRVGDSKTSLQSSESNISGNYFYHCDGEAEIISNKSCLNQYSENTFVGCGGALTLRHGNACVVQENCFFGDGRKGTGGVRIIGEGHSVQFNLFHGLTGDDGRAALSIMNGIPDSPANGYIAVQNATIQHNTFFDCAVPILVGLRDKDQKHQSTPPTRCRFRNNLALGRHAVFSVRTAATETASEGNLYHGSELGLDDTTGWNRLPIDTKYDSGRLISPIFQNAGEYAGTMQEIDALTLPSDTGPEWMKPGDEFLPELLKAVKNASEKK